MNRRGYVRGRFQEQMPKYLDTERRLGLPELVPGYVPGEAPVIPDITVYDDMGDVIMGDEEDEEEQEEKEVGDFGGLSKRVGKKKEVGDFGFSERYGKKKKEVGDFGFSERYGKKKEMGDFGGLSKKRFG